MNKSDACLIELFNNGDPRSLSAISELFFPEMYRLAFLFTGDSMEAEDIVQESLVVLWKKRAAIISIYAAKKYFQKVVKSKSIDAINRKARQTKILLECNYLGDGIIFSGHNYSIKSEDIFRVIDEGIQKLPQRTKRIFKLILAGKSTKEVSELLEIDRVNVGKIKYRGIATLRKYAREKISTSPIFH